VINAVIVPIHNLLKDMEKHQMLAAKSVDFAINW